MVNCDILIRENRRTLCITIGKEGEVIVKAPTRLTESEINIFITKKQKWIQNNVNKIKSNIKQFNDITQMKKILLFNEMYNIEELERIKTTTFQNKTLYIKPSSLENRQKQIKKWFIKFAFPVLENRLNYFANIMNLEYSSFKLTNAKTKWGSCSSQRDIDLRWRLILLKSNLQDYVIVHELCHLLEMNHSQKFYKCIECVISDYKNRRKEIKNSNFILQLYR